MGARVFRAVLAAAEHYAVLARTEAGRPQLVPFAGLAVGKKSEPSMLL
jgi:hypothetical protein